MSRRSIGVFDSGVGGLTVVSALMRRLPGESILYLGDTARLPYGSKSLRTVERYTRRNVDFLVRRGVKAVVVACNTASALALDRRTARPRAAGPVEAGLPIWGVVEPGAEAAVAVSRGRVGILATESTVRSAAYPRAIRRLDRSIEVLSRTCALFVPLVEEGWSDDPVAELIARRYLEPLLAAGVDTLVLGCTHYPVLAPTLRRIAGPGVELVDSAETMARTVERELGLADLLAPAGHRPRHHLCVTDVGEHFQRLARQLLPGTGEPPSLEWVEV